MAGIFNTRSHFSLGESLLKPDEIVKEAKRVGATSVVITDTMSVCALPEFMGAAKKEGIKGIMGARLRLYDVLFTKREEKKKYRPFHVRVIALNQKGVDMLFSLLSKAYEGENYYEVGRLTVNDVIDAMIGMTKDDVVLTLGDTYSIMTTDNVATFVNGIRAVSDAKIAVDIVTAETPYFMRQNFEALKLAKEYNLEVIFESPAFYKEEGVAESLDVMKCIAKNFSYNDMAAKDTVKDWVIKSFSESVRGAISSCRKAISRFSTDAGGIDDKELKSIIMRSNDFMQEIEKKAVYEWKPCEPSLPKMSEDDFALLKKKCLEGWSSRLGREVFGYKPTDLAPYKERLVYELNLIRDKKFSAYFLLVAKVTSWCNEVGIKLGPGRGSCGGSLVAYLMGITQVDPIRFNLLFERFINPSRHDLPDIDLDFMSSRREEVIKYIESEFGQEYVAGVSNYTKLAGAGSLSDVSKKMGIENVPAFGSWFEKEHGVSETLTEALKNSPQLEKFAKEHPDEVKHALTLEGTLRSYGKHAAGIIVAGVPISQKAVVEKRSGSNVVCWDKRSCEEFGLVKLDILGLSNLDMIDIAQKHIKSRTGKDLDLFSIPLDDAEVLKEFGEGSTVGVFQFSSSMMRGILKDMYKSGTITFDDLCAATALGRPGPLDAGMVEDYIKRKNGESPVTYPHYAAEASMKATYGVLCFQETIMRVVQDVAGLSPVDAEGVRKAIGKKELEKMKSYREQFISGSTAGFANVTLEDGRVVKIHLARQLMCADGKTRTIQEAFYANAEITEAL